MGEIPTEENFLKQNKRTRVQENQRTYKRKEEGGRGGAPRPGNLRLYTATLQGRNKKTKTSQLESYKASSQRQTNLLSSSFSR